MQRFWIKVCNLQLYNRDIGDRQRAIGDRQRAIGDRQRAIGDREKSYWSKMYLTRASETLFLYIKPPNNVWKCIYLILCAAFLHYREPTLHVQNSTVYLVNFSLFLTYISILNFKANLLSVFKPFFGGEDVKNGLLADNPPPPFRLSNCG